MKPRYAYDLSCFNAITGNIGRLQTVTNIPIVANDTISIDLVGALRLSRLKRFLTIDCRWDIFAFFCPYRHTYSNFKDAIIDGIETSETFTTYDATGGGTSTTLPNYLGPVPNSSTLPFHFIHDYNDIYYNYFYPLAVQATGGTLVPTAVIFSDGVTRKYGQEVARLPAMWTTGVDDTRGDSTAAAEVSASAGAGAINLIDLRRVQAEYQDALEHDWFAERYRDVLKHKWGTGRPPTIDADARPQLLMHSKGWLSGYDVDGTDDAQLGNWRGKAQGIAGLRMPPKYFNEHGTLWIVMCLRFPSILQEEKHYLSTNTLSYDNLMGDPNVINATPPIALDQDDFTDNGSGTSMGTHPYAQWYRCQPSRIHSDFHGLEGFPFESVDDLSAYTYCQTYSFAALDFFLNEDLGQWNFVSKAKVDAYRVIPPATHSIRTGTILH